MNRVDVIVDYNVKEDIAFIRGRGFSSGKKLKLKGESPTFSFLIKNAPSE